MGRELKRVSLSFDWPIDKVWSGYLNPYSDLSIECPHCRNGQSPEYTRLESLWYSHLGGGFKPEDRGSTPFLPTDEVAQRWAKRQCSGTPHFYGTPDDQRAVDREASRICALWNASWSHHLNDADVAALIKADRLNDFTHDRISGKKRSYWRRKPGNPVPTARQVNEWSLSGMGHDSINSWIVIRAELKRLKQPSSCAHCKGHGHTWPDSKTKWRHDHWKRKEPPEGRGYQIWETVSEGSPISPVFAEHEDLAAHMSTTRWGADQGTSYETWLSFVRGPGWAPSMIGEAGNLMMGVEGVVKLANHA